MVPLHKTGNKFDVKNYRPVALLSSPAKLFEHIIYTKLFRHIQPIVSDSQHAFVPERSTVTNL